MRCTQCKLIINCTDGDDCIKQAGYHVHEDSDYHITQDNIPILTNTEDFQTCFRTMNDAFSKTKEQQNSTIYSLCGSRDEKQSFVVAAGKQVQIVTGKTGASVIQVECNKKTKRHDKTKEKNKQFVKLHGIYEKDFALRADAAEREDDYFSRQLSTDNRTMLKQEILDSSGVIFRSPATCRTLFGTFSDLKNTWIKGKDTTIEGILKDTAFDKTVSADWSLLISRLAPVDYHRFHAPISGKIINITEHVSDSFSVAPELINSDRDVYGTNHRKILTITSKHFVSPVYMVIVGASCTNTIELFKQIGDTIKIGKVLGSFHYGGSTILTFIHTGDINRFVRHKLLYEMNSDGRKQELYMTVGTPLFKL